MTPKTVVSSDVIADAVHVACRAPSIHNSQPWKFVGEGGGLLHLHLERDRLVDTDSSGRQALLSCGAVLDHLRVAMAAAGWLANVDYYPNPNDLGHLASIDFVPMSFVTEAHRRRADAILTRRTDRLPFGAPTNWTAFEPLLRHAVDADLALLDVLPEHSRPRLAEASQLTESLRLYDSSYHAELAWWTGPFGATDGIPHSSLVSAAESDRVDIGRTFPVTHHTERRAQVAEDKSAIVLLSALDDDRRDILTCGEALSAALLEATMAGLATCPLTHMTEVEASREILCGLSGRALPQVLIRMGVIPAMDDAPPPTPRRPLNDVLSWRAGRGS
ncbi:FMN-binding protein Acg [soil metagenome]